MSIRALTFSQLVCDSCGAHRETPEPDSTAARISASGEGWKYTAWDLKGKGLQKRHPDPKRPNGFVVDSVPRQWDCCPGCPLPESPVDAARIRSERKVQNDRGHWVDRAS